MKKYERLYLLYCERILVSKPPNPSYKEAYDQNKEAVIQRYFEKANRLKEKCGVKAKAYPITNSDLILLEIAGSAEKLKDALLMEFDEYTIPPETRIVLPGERVGRSRLGSSERGYKMALNRIISLGHNVDDTSTILRKGLDSKT
jgi:hypothetical protein